MKKIVVYYDMDGVLVRYPKDEKGPKNFLDMKPIEEMVDMYRKLSEDPRYDVYIASTAPWSNPESWMHKRMWVEKYLGKDAKKRLILTHNKQLLMGDYLIDDRSANGAAEFKGEWIKYKEGKMSVEEILKKIDY